MGKTWGRWASVFALAMWAGACASSAAPAAAPPLPTFPEAFPRLGSEILEVRLVYDAALDCIFVDYNGTRLPAMWPSGYAWTPGRDGVQSADGNHVARIDELTRVIAVRARMVTVQFGGGGTVPTPKSSWVSDGDALFILGLV